MLRSWNSMISKILLPPVSHISFLSPTLCELKSFLCMAVFTRWKLTGSESVRPRWFRISFPKERFSQGHRVFIFECLGNARQACWVILLSRLSCQALPGCQWESSDLIKPPNYKSLNIALYMGSLIGSDVKAVCCPRKHLDLWAGGPQPDNL